MREEILIFQGHLPCAMKTEEGGLAVIVAAVPFKLQRSRNRRPDRYRSLPTATFTYRTRVHARTCARYRPPPSERHFIWIKWASKRGGEG